MQRKNITKRKWTQDSRGVTLLQTRLITNTPHELAACFHGIVGSTTRQTHFYGLLPKKIPIIV